MNIQLAMGVIALLLVLFLLMNRRHKDGGKTTASPIAGAFSWFRRTPKPDAQPEPMPMVAAVQETAAAGTPELAPMAPPPAPAAEAMVAPHPTAPMEPIAPPVDAEPTPPVDAAATVEPPQASSADWAAIEEPGWPSLGEVEGSWSQGSGAPAPATPEPAPPTAPAPALAAGNDGYVPPTEPLVGWTPRESGEATAPPTIEFPATPEPAVEVAPTRTEPMGFEAPQPPVADPAAEALAAIEPVRFDPPQPASAEPAAAATEHVGLDLPEAPLAPDGPAAPPDAHEVAPGIEIEVPEGGFDAAARWTPTPDEAPRPDFDVPEYSPPAIDAAADWSSEPAGPESPPSSHAEIDRAVQEMAPAAQLLPAPIEIAQPAQANELHESWERGGALLWDELGPAPAETAAQDSGSDAVAWWDEYDAPEEATTEESAQLRFGRFALAGVASRPGEQAICGVSFSERAPAPPQAAQIRLTVAGAENCRRDDVSVMAKPGFAPSEEGFTVVASAEDEGPFMVSGTYHVD